MEDYRNPKNFEHVKPEADTTTTTTAGPPTTGATSAGSAPATGTTFDINHNKVPGKWRKFFCQNVTSRKHVKVSVGPLFKCVQMRSYYEVKLWFAKLW